MGLGQGESQGMGQNQGRSQRLGQGQGRSQGRGQARVSEEEDKLNLAILSGKGVPGKLPSPPTSSLITGASYIDCDVEEPNGFIFLNPSQIKSREVKVDYPVIDRVNVPYAGLSARYASLMPW